MLKVHVDGRVARYQRDGSIVIFHYEGATRTRRRLGDQLRGRCRLIRRIGAILALLAGCAATAVVPSLAPSAAASTGPFRVVVLSGKPAWISGPKALVAVVVPTRSDLASVEVTLGSHDVTHQLTADRVQGLLTGVPALNRVGLSRGSAALVGLVHLTPGTHLLRATLSSGRRASVRVTDYADRGPMFAGKQVMPWFCNDQPTRENRAACLVPTHYAYYYLPSGSAGVGNHPSVGAPPSSSQFVAYNVQDPPSPGSIARTTTDEGVTVPYIVRVETGVVDRDTYQIAVLATPKQSYTPWSPPPAWNHKVDVEIGGDCRPWHDQAKPLTVFDAHALGRGFAVVTGALDVLGNNCNPVVAAEAFAMIKSRLVDEYGVIRYTLGEGCSGGSIILNAMTSNYPGLVDGTLLMCSFPDIWQVVQQAEDCHLLDKVFDAHPGDWSAAKQDYVTGFLEPTTCRGFFDGAQGSVSAKVPDYAQSLLDPSRAASCTSNSDTTWVYDADTNPGGARCTLQDYQGAIWGQRPRNVWTSPERRIGHGFANRPFDNVGVQYGLTALNAGQITVPEFLSLNREVGGLGIDWNRTAARSVADPQALDVAYRTGQVLDPHAQAGVPIIDLRGHDNEEIHLDIDSYVQRARLDAATGGHRNQALWFELGEDAQDPSVTARAFNQLDAWLANIEADRTGRSLAAEVAAARPDGAADQCWTIGLQVLSWDQCRGLFAHGTDPRIAAGGPMQDNVMKCRLTAPLRSAYHATFTTSEWRRLHAIFPGGVCDYSRPSVGSHRSETWRSFD
ncbi:MAG TPA: DUF6351 family protein [Mycobacteriales bacterium]|nr:DUF6351 family protein [Mycobacteriales bacterium]